MTISPAQHNKCWGSDDSQTDQMSQGEVRKDCQSPLLGLLIGTYSDVVQLAKDCMKNFVSRSGTRTFYVQSAIRPNKSKPIGSLLTLIDTLHCIPVLSACLLGVETTSNCWTRFQSITSMQPNCSPRILLVLRVLHDSRYSQSLDFTESVSLLSKIRSSTRLTSAFSSLSPSLSALYLHLSSPLQLSPSVSPSHPSRPLRPYSSYHWSLEPPLHFHSLPLHPRPRLQYRESPHGDFAWSSSFLFECAIGSRDAMQAVQAELQKSALERNCTRPLSVAE